MRSNFDNISLEHMPVIRSSGAFITEDPRLEWLQPINIYMGHLYWQAGRAIIDGHSMSFEKWDLVIYPPGSRCEVIWKESDGAIYDYFAFQPCDSNSDMISIPRQHAFGEEGPHWDTNFRRALSRQMISRTSIQVVITAILWAIAQPVKTVRKSVYIEQAEFIIEKRLAETIRVKDLAKELHISQSQLVRLFLQEYGRTPIQVIRQKRAISAHNLLCNSTLPVKQVANSCGYPDLQAFNKFIRECYGISPRTLRNTRPEIDLYRLGSSTNRNGGAMQSND